MQSMSNESSRADRDHDHAWHAAVSAVERASAALVDASVGERDDDQVRALQYAYASLRCVLADLKRFAS
jgi:hypothetical protein